MLRHALVRFGRVATLANVVGKSMPGKTVVDLPLDEWNDLLSVNLTSIFLMCTAAIPAMQKAGGGTSSTCPPMPASVA